MQGSARSWTCAGSLLLSLAMLVAADASYQRARSRWTDLDMRLGQARASVPSLASHTPANSEKDFAQSLGAPLNAAQVVQELQRACAAASVLLVGVQAQERAASVDQLGRLELAVTLHGAYTGSKQVLQQVLERYPHITVQRLRMRRAQSPAEVDTSVTLAVWSAPSAAAVADR